MARKRKTSRGMRRNDRRWGLTPIEEANRMIEMAGARLDALLRGEAGLLRGEAGYHREGNGYVMMAWAFNYLLQADLTANSLMWSEREEERERGMSMRSEIQSICSGLLQFAEQARVSARAVNWVPR